MHILYISSSPTPSKAANAIQVMRMCEAFVKAGHCIGLIAPSGPLQVADKFAHFGLGVEFPIFRVTRPKGTRGRIAFGIQCVWYLRRQVPDLAYTRSLYAALIAVTCCIPTVYEVHMPAPTRFHHAAEKYLFQHRAFRYLVSISQALADEYYEPVTEATGKKVVVAHDASVGFRGQGGCIHDWPGRNGCLQVGYVGHLYDGKGMEVISALAPRLPLLDFHVVGGTTADISLWKDSVDVANIHFHGYVPHGRLLPLYNQFDILLAPYQRTVRVSSGKADVSRWMSPLKIFEYMSTGKPIVCSDLPVLREVLEPEINALLVDPEDTEGWVSAIKRLSDNEGLREQLGTSAARTYETQYTWNQRATKVLTPELRA